ncbi:hypothetical protein LCGC14_1971330 [marine sediment metagenome]|uniref:HNH endonuclease 5 domain-containing protein n=1 Tax=marine sediment metagenome TaxID=412755 RepID=A0A0F9FZV1_9ZZZZ
MKCQKCNGDFEEKDIDESHDIPKWCGGTDLDGRHYLCKKCHGVYEWVIIKIIWEAHTNIVKQLLRGKIKRFSIKYFGEVDDPQTITET